ncbi:MAG: tetratricopeptide repeat protein [Comamonadaceae bacterium]|nr:tetratricopeptide repeat protein [Comamonadaceae bacterium]
MADNAGEDEYAQRRAAARWLACCSTQKQYDEALEAARRPPEGKPREFDALVADRRGDVLLPLRARPARRSPPTRRPTRRWTPRLEYRRLVEAKLTGAGRRARRRAGRRVGVGGAAT